MSDGVFVAILGRSDGIIWAQSKKALMTNDQGSNLAKLVALPTSEQAQFTVVSNDVGECHPRRLGFPDCVPSRKKSREKF